MTRDEAIALLREMKRHMERECPPAIETEQVGRRWLELLSEYQDWEEGRDDHERARRSGFH